jgi:hypothetical protein
MIPTAADALPFSFSPLFDAQRDVFAHYFPTFPLSIDNRAPLADYYNTQYLSPAGESGKWKAQGGFLRSRPLPVAPNASNTRAVFCTANMQREVQLAISRGLTGFCHDLLSVNDAMTGTLPWMLSAAAAVDTRFKIVPMFDMNSLGASFTTDQALAILELVAASPVAKRLRDGRMLFSAYNAPAKSLPWWQSLIAAANAQRLSVAFLPVLVGGPNDAGTLNAISWGVGAWGTATPSPSAALNPTKAHAAGLKFMSPIDPQQSRPKSSIYWEASNLLTFINAWTATISTGCDLVQFVTWNDYSEASQLAPVTDATFNQSLGTGFFDLTAFYATWFATGVAPVITRDVLYFCHRRHPSNAAHPNQANNFAPAAGTGAAEDSIELLAFLTDAGTIKINAHAQAVPAGISAFKVPLEAGVPVFALQRNGSDVFSCAGPAQIYDAAGMPSGLLDMTYLSGSVSLQGLAAYSW